MVQIGETDDEEKPKFTSLQKNQSIEDISLDEALNLFMFPKTIGQYESKEVVLEEVDSVLILNLIIVLFQLRILILIQ